MADGRFTGPVLRDLVEPLRGYRSWRLLRHLALGSSGPVLTSMWSPVPWPGDTLQAQCRIGSGVPQFHGAAGYEERHQPEIVPVYECSCGIYAYHAPPDARVDRIPPEVLVVGVVAAYGRVIVGERGLRASTVRVLALAPEPSPPKLHHRSWMDWERHWGDWGKVAPMLQARYPSVRFHDSVVEMVKAWPPSPPVALGAIGEEPRG